MDSKRKDIGAFWRSKGRLLPIPPPAMEGQQPYMEVDTGLLPREAGWRLSIQSSYCWWRRHPLSSMYHNFRLPARKQVWAYTVLLVKQCRHGEHHLPVNCSWEDSLKSQISIYHWRARATKQALLRIAVLYLLWWLVCTPGNCLFLFLLAIRQFSCVFIATFRTF